MTLAEVADELDNLAQTYAESGQFPAVTFADHVREQAAVARTADADLRACRERAAALEAVAAAARSVRHCLSHTIALEEALVALDALDGGRTDG